MNTYCRDGNCNHSEVYKTEGVVSWAKPKNPDIHGCCKTCEFSVECPKKCTEFHKESCDYQIVGDSWKEAWHKWLHDDEERFNTLSQKVITE